MAPSHGIVGNSCLVPTCALHLAVILARTACSAAVASPPCELPACRALALDDRQCSAAEGSSVSLLQRRGATPSEVGGPLAKLDPESQAQRLESARPLGWVHVPKTGTSLVNFLIHLPGICPEVDEDFSLDKKHILYEGTLVAFADMLLPSSSDGACPGSFVNDGFHYAAGGSAWLNHYQGHSITMLRQPEQRILSGYNFNHVCWKSTSPPASVLEYAEKHAGCAVRMITSRQEDCIKRSCGCCFNNNEGIPTQTEVDLAIQRIQTGFVFVGITEQWALSICLGHRIFGGRCRQSDFVDVRVSDHEALEANATQSIKDAIFRAEESVLPEIEPWNTTALNGWHDPYDGALYAAAQERFQRDLDLYGVTLESCQPCFEEAGVKVEA